MEGDACDVTWLTLRTNISIHALRVEGDIDSVEFVNNVTCISIHALRVEGDAANLIVSPLPKLSFLSTPSGWRATKLKVHSKFKVAISIHALRVEGDSVNPFWV